MKNKLIIALTVVLAFLMLLPVVFAETKQVDLESEFMTVQSKVVGLELTGPIASLFGNEKINVHLTTSSKDEVVIGIITEDKKIKAMNLAAVKDPTLEVFSDEKTVAKVLVSKNPLAQLQKALGEKKITYTALGFFHKMKFAIVDMFVDVLKGANPGDAEDIDVEIIHGTPTPVAKPKEEAKPVEAKAPEVKTDEKKDAGLTGAVTAAVISGTVHTVSMVNTGFDPELLEINAGDTVVWKNTRTGPVKNAMIIGTQKCIKARSSMFKRDETYEWTFTQPGKCMIVDGYMTTKTMVITIN